MKNYVVLLVVFFSWFGVAHAGVIINEIAWMGNSSNVNAEWIELKGEKGTDLSNWTISGSVSITIPAGKKINENGFFLLGRQPVNEKNIYTYVPNFTPDYTYNGALVNTGGDLVLSGSDTDALYFSKLGWPDGYNGDYKTMQWNGNKWIYASPTPGSINSGVSDTNSSTNSSEDNTIEETIDPIPLIEEDPLAFKITTKIISPKIAVAGIPFFLSSLTTTNRGETYNFGKFIWNFGDGMQVGVKESKPFDYIYEYPGEYVLNLSYFDNSFVEIPDATDRIIIKVIPSDVYISSVGTDSDPYIELENKSKYEVILSGWIIKGGDKTFIFPEGTTLLQGKKIKLSPKITGFTFDDIKYITILNPSNEVITTYPKENKKTVQAYGVNNSNYNNSVLPKNVLENNTSIKDPQIINLNDLGASASDVKVGIPSLTYSIIGLIVIIGLGITSFLFIKKKKEIPDYVERGISAKDMTIIE